MNYFPPHVERWFKDVRGMSSNEEITKWMFAEPNEADLRYMVGNTVLRERDQMQNARELERMHSEVKEMYKDEKGINRAMHRQTQFVAVIGVIATLAGLVKCGYSGSPKPDKHEAQQHTIPSDNSPD